MLSLKDGKKLTTAKYYKIDQSQTVETFHCQNVFCIDTSQIHGVVNESISDRVILSISFKDDYDNFNTINKMYSDGNLI